MKSLFTFLSILLVGSLMAQSGPKIIFKKTNHDFGTVAEGPQITTEFNFKNEGDEPLILSNVKASCGCTVPNWPKEPILPGQSSQIEVKYNTQRRIGNFNKSITISSNADDAAKVIYIKGKVEAEPEEETMPVKQPNNMLAPSK